jgi:glyoxylase-like metal-dependent hydrolase (beta-lactamase superfamily II)
MVEKNVAEGIHRVEHTYTNYYLVEDDDGVCIVDACVPTAWESLPAALKEIGRALGDVRALALTHAHFDHIGFAERARSTLGIPVWVHENDVPLTKHPRQFAHERLRTPYYLTQFRAFPMVAAFVWARALWPSPIAEVTRYVDGTLPVPGSPRVVFTPGHTLGHCAFHYPERNAVIAGDAIVTLDPYTAEAGPRIVAGAATADSARALASLDALAETGAATALVGHGDPWRQGAEAAVERARAAGPS